MNIKTRCFRGGVAFGVAAAALLSWQSQSRFAEHVPLFFLISAVMLSASVLSYSAAKRLPSTDSAQNFLYLIALAAGLQLVASFGAPLFEDDYFRYLWDGYVTHVRGSPYGVAPEAFFSEGAAVLEPMRVVLDGVNHPEVPTIYGPAAQWVFAFSYWLAPGSELMLRSLFGALHCLAIALAWRALPATARPGLWLYVLNPLVYKEVALTGHFDFLVGFGLLLGLVAICSGKVWRAGVYFAVAFCSKLTAGLVLPLVLIMLASRAPGPLNLHWIKPAAKFLCAFVVVIVALYLPFLLHAPETSAGLGVATDLLGLHSFASHWQFNAGLASVLSWWVPQTLLRWSLALVGGTLMLAALFALAGDARERNGIEGHLLLALVRWLILLYGFLLLCGPVLNPWYALWIMPLALLLDDPTLRVGRAVSASLTRDVSAVSLTREVSAVSLTRDLSLTCTFSLLSYYHGLFLPDSGLQAYEIPGWMLAVEHAALWFGALWIGIRLRSATKMG